MADRPIIFSALMIKALLAGRKTQTRRVLSLPKWASTDPTHFELSGPSEASVICRDTGCLAAVPMRFAVGDRLWVKENHRFPRQAEQPGRKPTVFGPVRYEADQHWYLGQEAMPGKLRPSIHMPHWASRMTLVVTDVRVERLQDISEADAVAEGASGYPATESHRMGFREIWEGIHGVGAWDENPWLVAVSFTKHGAISSMPDAT